MKITIVNTPSSKSNDKWCPWLIEIPAEVGDSQKK